MKLKEFRTRLGLTQKELAKRVNTTQQTVARWEIGQTQLNVDQVKDLCLVLQCKVEELIGWEIPVEEWRETPFAVSDAGTPYGTLSLKTTVGNRDYPVDEKARESFLNQLNSLDNLRGQETSRPWLYSWTLDNKILLINPEYVRRIELIGDDVEAMPAFHHPEVYRALDDWIMGRVTGKVREVCESLIEEMGEENATRIASDVRVTFDDGEDEWCPLTEGSASSMFGLEAGTFNVARCSFAEVEEEGYYSARYVNLDRVVMIEIPSDRYHRITAPE
ncbi:helix-turn-helix transcriptional regulator [Sinorhizobium meliloti]|uniref:helix-turn-helix transcriptional regulator n=1 Tax=Rhizobium meliloti TaxID=382 RepID=UPI000FD9D739|nr:helix-turn-helix transcriptional regulator [Sinorhizobium meliloti]RVH00100.1 XRE family transcriptional regulator [Sinorhizobium meliloti]